ncbi:DUF2244 domain-containing protein [Primorskyibacter sp. S87]|uniref:DUF2244 domain-containing protein n=1 Tax=Primorskyibacter sp. S87 TaxID=3415126 RepID=UPI003C7CC5F0
MPYSWTEHTPEEASSEATRVLRLWPHNSLPPRGAAAVILALFALATLPMIAVLGSVVLWGILPFVLIVVAGIWAAIEANYRSRRILETLTLTDRIARLTRENPGGDMQVWHCNRYWAKAEMHEKDGPVPFYVTLKGGGREVEIGAFLSEDERKALYDELDRALR